MAPIDYFGDQDVVFGVGLIAQGLSLNCNIDQVLTDDW